MRGDSRAPGPVLGEEGFRYFCCPSPSLAAPPPAAGAQMSGASPAALSPSSWVRNVLPLCASYRVSRPDIWIVFAALWRAGKVFIPAL